MGIIFLTFCIQSHIKIITADDYYLRTFKGKS